MLHKGISILYTLFRQRIMPAVILLTLGLQVAYASGTEPYQHELRGKLKKGDTLIVQDEKFRNPAYDWSKIKHHSVQDYIVLDLFPDSLKRITQPFTCELDLKVEYWSQPGQEDPVVIESVPLKISYDTATGAVYQSRDIYAFKNAHRIKITVNKITCQGLEEVPGCFILTGQIFIERQYTLDEGATIKPFVVMEEGQEQDPQQKSGGFSTMALTAPVPDATGNRLKLTWTHAVGVEEIDLEWTTISSSSDWGDIVSKWESGAQQMDLPAFVALFRNNSTRITTEEQEYTISLVYSDDYLMFRMRTVTYTAGVRNEGPWSYVYRPVGGSEDKFSIIKLPVAWHEPDLNWSYSGAFAEGGKKKEVVSYMDGTMRNRQTVTVNNSNISTVSGSSETVVVQEEIYDEFGRPVASMMPAPLKNETSLKYYPGAYLNGVGKAYNFKNVYGVISGSVAGCINKPLPVSNTSGAGRYFSPQNDFMNDPAEPYHNYIPDAEGYPLAVKRYTADKTGRMTLAGGVGSALQPDPAVTDPHTTRIFYSKPGQWELDRIFGSDVGLASHYFKTTTIDPNGQASVSYVNMTGKTIATALAGPAPAATEALPSLPEKISITQPLLQPTDFVFDPAQLKMTGTTTYVTPIKDNVELAYDIQQLVYKYTQGLTICSNCYYALTITVHDNCGIEKYKTTTPVNIGSSTANCSLVANKQGSTIVELDPGEYFITYELALSPDVIADYTEAYIQQNTNLRTQFSFIMDQLSRADFKGCFNECTTCLASLGTQANFSTRILEKLTASGVDVNANATVINTWISGLYSALLSNCQAIQGSCTVSPCERYRKLMQADVTPGGQYALFNEEGLPMEQNINVLFLHFRDAFPEGVARDEAEKNKITDNEGNVISANDPSFTLEMLVKYWKPSWADKFVRYHPEACKLAFCEENSTYYTWDEKVKTRIQTAADIPVILPGSQYQQSVAHWLLEADPFFKSPGSPGYGYYTQMHNDLLNYSQNILLLSGADANTKSLTQYVDYLLYCADPSGNTSSGNPKDWNNCTPVAGCRVTDREWQLYRDIYFELKDRFYKIKRDESCGEDCPVGQPAELTASGCPSSQAFVITKIAADTALILYEGAVLDRQVTVTLYYPGEYYGYTKQEVFYFNPGDSGKTFLIDPLIQLNSVLVKSVSCSAVTLTPRPCSGVGGTLNVPAGTKQTAPNTFEVLSGGVLTTYKITKGLADVPDTTYCGGTATRTFYNCLYVKHPTSDYDVQYANVWLLTCTAGGAALMAGDGLQAATTSPALAGEGMMLRPPDSGYVGCNGILPSDFTLEFVSYDNVHGYYYYNLFYNGPTLPEGTGVNYNLYYNGSLISSKQFIPSSSNPQVVMVSDLDTNDPYFYESEDAFVSLECFGEVLCPEELLYKTSRFPDYSTTLPDVATLTAENAQKVAVQINTACDAQADTWMQQLAPCLDGKGVSQSVRNTLRAKLVEVCTLGGDIDHIFGASTAAPGKSTFEGYTSFKQVIVSVLGAGAFDMECNPWLLESPFPYKTQAQAMEKEISNTDATICAKLASEKQQHQLENPGVTFFQYLTAKYGAAMNITAAELAMLEKGCNNCRFILEKNITLPVFLVPGAKGCITLSEFTDALQALAAEGMAGYSSSHANYEAVYTNYLNHKWGFTLGYEDYKTFEVKVNTNPSTAGLLCNEPVYTKVNMDPYACLMSVIDLSVNNGKREYDLYIEEEKRVFRRNYLNTCAATRANVKITANQQYYHYTLYYYDQAGNLVRTVPPEGVDVLTEEWQFDAINASRGNTLASCTYSGPTGNTDKSAALLQLSSTLSGTSRSVEMWVYNPAAAPGQVLAVTSDKKYLLNTCLDGRYLHVEIQSMTGASATVAELIASNHLTVDMQPLMPLRPWTHIVFTSAQPLASQPFDVYVNGTKCNIVASPPNAACGWEITANASNIIYPENLTILKQLRMYNRVLPASEILNNAREGCLNVTGLAPVLWARFNAPAAGSETVLAPGTTVETQYSGYYPSHTIPTSYAFNSLNSVEEQVTPDAGRSMFWYDVAGRLIISQNEEQRSPSNGASAGRYSYTRYDALGRITEVGEKTGGSDLTSEHHRAQGVQWFDGYNLTGTNAQVTRTYYDMVPSGLSGIVNGLPQSNLRKRVAISAYSENGATADQVSYYDYDLNGNVKSIWKQVKEIGLKRIEYEYDLISGKVNFIAYQRNFNDQFFYQYKYDAENRLVEAKTGITASTDWRGLGTITNGKVDAIYRYYKHGPLARVELGDAKLQGQDYAYTLQGWLKGVNGHFLDPATEMGQDGANGVGKDVFAYTLGYFTGDYEPVEAASGAFPLTYQAQTGDITGHSLYNGNIGHSTVALSMPAAGLPMAYSYRYDQLNRLVKQRQHTIGAGTTTWGLAQRTDAYMENVGYDANGNILNYFRKAGDVNAAMDNLQYIYPRDGANKLTANHLRHIKEDAAVTALAEDIENQPDDNYNYDKIGNLISETEEGITDIEWTVYGKIRKITKPGTTIEYAYDAEGRRVYKKQTTGAVVDKTWYLYDAGGNVLGVYGTQNGATQTYWKEQHLYGSSRLGMWIPDMDVQSTGSSALWNSVGLKRYELANHLGNVMAIISDAAKVNGYPVVTNAQDYYPFGMLQPGRVYKSVAGKAYRYGFNGKENDNEVKGEGNQQDYGMRIYDPRIGKFLSVDPITKQYPELTPYQFASNSPISGIDLDGEEYLHFSEALVQFKNGALELKLENMYTITQNLINSHINDPRNWPYDEHGVKMQGKSLAVATFSMETRNPSKGVDGVNLSDKDENPNYDPTKLPMGGTTWYTAKRNGLPQEINTGGGAARPAAAKASLVINLLNFGMEAIGGYMVNSDINDARDQARKYALMVTEDINAAMGQGLIPEKYQDHASLINIGNVIFQGVNNTKDENIYNIGMKIFNEISLKRFAQTGTIKSTLDNIPSRQIEIPRIDESKDKKN